jgi:hypothetical protein
VKFAERIKKKIIQQKLANFSQILGIINNIFRPTLVQKCSRIMCTIHWLSPFFYIGVKFGPLEEKEEKNTDIITDENFSE